MFKLKFINKSRFDYKNKIKGGRFLLASYGIFMKNSTREEVKDPAKKPILKNTNNHHFLHIG